MWKLSVNELTRNSSGITRPQSFQFAELVWTDPDLESGISVCDLISTLKKRVQTGNELLNVLPEASQTRKKPPYISSLEKGEQSFWQIPLDVIS